jgi:hypothetical protein
VLQKNTKMAKTHCKFFGLVPFLKLAIHVSLCLPTVSSYCNDISLVEGLGLSPTKEF